MMNQINAQASGRRQTTEQAIQLAIQGRWQEAVQLNRQLIAAFPEDVDAYNRLGKALTELGQYPEARAAYTRTLELDPANGIARKNLARLMTLGEVQLEPVAGEKVDPNLFVEEIGKTAVTVMREPALENLARMAAGDRVYLKQQDKSLLVENGRGEYLGGIESRLALRLLKLMEGGNEYAAAIAALEPSGGRVIIKETFQHPSQAGKPSFPPTNPEGFRPYTKHRLLRHELEEEDVAEEEASEDWSEEAEGGESPLSLQTHLRRGTAKESEDDFDE
jgi:tetratricopeptide (TPR) repeat protein